MLGFLGMMLFGIAYAGSWISDDNKEKQRRQSARENSRDFYYDKSGIMRHVNSGRKFSKEEVHNKFFPGKRREIDNELFENKYFAVLNPYKSNTQEVFDTYDKAKEYINICKMRNKSVVDEPWNICRWIIENKKSKFTFILHF